MARGEQPSKTRQRISLQRIQYKKMVQGNKIILLHSMLKNNQYLANLGP